MNVAVIKVDEKEALEKYKQYLNATKKQYGRQYTAARRAYRALSKGLKVIDIYAAFEKTGKKSDDSPKLAIVRADARQVFFTKLPNGAGCFKRQDPFGWSSKRTNDEVELPEGTFKNWQPGIPSATNRWSHILNANIVTNVPFIPAHIFIPGEPENYHILFEVDQWKRHAKVRDPYLLQRLNDNTFVVLAEWDVSPVEASIMRAN